MLIKFIRIFLHFFQEKIGGSEQGNHGQKCLIILMFVGLMIGGEAAAARPNYADALRKSIMFFEGQRSGRLPSSQRVRWRNGSALRDGSDIRVDLVGGYYDAGDNVKFHFPMAFTTTMLAWSVLEFGNLMGLDLKHALGSVRWGTDYFLKATGVPGAVVAQVGDAISDHDCWERPEDMDTLRTSYVVNRTHPGSEVSAEIAAALAATSIIFKTSDRKYSNKLLQRAEEVFNFADSYQGAYNGACPFYCDGNGYQDELIWGAAWLFKATNNPKYWNYVVEKMKSLGGSCAEFGWDAKHAGINILVAPLVMHTAKSDPFIPNADTFVCSILPNSPTKSVTYSPGGLLFKPGGSNLQHATALSFLLLVYSRYLHSARRMVHCGDVVATSTALVHIAKSQVDYILGKNPLGMSYMVGYGKNFPKRIHHRGSSLPSVAAHEQRMGCRDGDRFLYREEPNINLLVGAIVGGPDCNDQYIDNRLNVSQSEPATYINGPFVGVLAYFNFQRTKKAMNR